MRYKYVVKKDAREDRLSLNEYARIENESFSLLNHRSFDLRRMESAVSGSRKELISALRTDNLYPPSEIMEKIVDAIAKLMGPENLDIAEVVVDDLDSLKEKRKRFPAPVPLEPEGVDIEAAEDVDAEAEGIPQTVPFTESTVALGDLFPLDDID